jgi:zinc protease
MKGSQFQSYRISNLWYENQRFLLFCRPNPYSMKYIIAIVLFFCGVSGLQAQPKLVEKVTPKGSEVVIPFEKYILPNGLTLIIHEDHSDPVIQVDVTYHVGSAREEIGKSGFAHFFEHMMFQGSDHVADEQHFKTVTAAGGTLNGSTNRDRTNYFETVPNNQLEKMLWLESDRMGFLLDAVTQQKFEVQRATVKNERGQNYDNRPYGLVSEVISKNLYPYGHPYSWLTIGYIEDLNRVNVGDLKNFFLRWYGPNNATVTVGGDVKPADVLRLVEKYFGPIPRGPEVRKTVLPAAVLDADRFVSYVDNYAKLPQLVVTYPTVALYHPDMPALACLAQVLGQGKNSILYQTLEKTQKALNATAFSSLSELAGEFSLRVTPTPGNSLADTYKSLQAALKTFEERGVTDDDVTKFKGSYEAQTISGLQSVSGKVFQLAQFQTLAGEPNMVGKLLREYNAVTKEDVLKVYNKYIKGKPSVILSVVTKGQESNLVAPDNYKPDPSHYKAPEYGYNGLVYSKPKDNFDRSRLPGNGPNPVVKVPSFWTKNLASGVRVIGTDSKELPIVTLSLTLPGGRRLDANDTSKVGLSRILALMMNEDTKNYTAEQLQLELQKLGSTISVSTDLDGLTFQVQTLKKNLDKTLALLDERLLSPKFTPEAFARVKKQSFELFKQIKSQPAAIADIVFDKINYGPDNVLGMSANGTEHTVANIKLEDVQALYNTSISSKGTRLVVVGDVSENEILSKINFLNKLPNKDIAEPAIKPAPTITKTKIYLVDVPKAAQTEFRIGYPTGLKFDATGEFYRAGLMNYVLGGTFNSRVNLNLREDKGWTYGARSSFTGDEFHGDFAFSSGIKAEATDSALTEVMKELRQYAGTGITPDEITFMKSAVGQRDALRYETGFQKAGFIGRILEYNLPADFADQDIKIMNDITAPEINTLAAKWINPDKMNIVLVGDKAKILPGLQKSGYEIVELDVNGNVKK